MKILCWDVRGLNKAGKLRSVRESTCKKDYDIICFLEHKIKQGISQMISSHWEGMEATDNLFSNPLGRILVLWNPLVVQLTKITESSQFIHFEASYSATRT